MGVGMRVDLKVGGFGCDPHVAAWAEGELRYCRGGDVCQGGWLPFEVEPDPVGQERQAGDPCRPGVADAAGLGTLSADDQRRRADRDEDVTVLAMVGNDEGPASGERHPGTVSAARVKVQANQFGDVFSPAQLTANAAGANGSRDR